MDVTELIGTPFEYGGRGPDSYDCYGLVKHLIETEQGLEVPDYKGYEGRNTVLGYFHAAIPMWQKCELHAGCVLLFKVPGAFHVAYALEDRRTFIHTWEHSGGVCVERISDWQSRLVGCYKYVR